MGTAYYAIIIYMLFHFNRSDYHPSPLLRGFQIFLLTLIVIGIGLLLTQKLWVPKLIDFILNDEAIVSPITTPSVKNISYIIRGETFTLVNGVSVETYTPNSATTNTLRIFGEPTYGDLDFDGDIDAAILLEHTPGGSGTFYYAVLALRTSLGYQASETMLLGDRIAPQTVEIHDGRAVFNFAERRSDEPMTAQPSIAKTVWVHYNKATNEIGEWVKDFEGESNIVPIEETTNTLPTQQQTSTVLGKTVLLANGCFWCVESDLEKVSGVIDVVSGYAGGSTENPTYKNYSDGGHREVVLVTYDANKVTYANLIEHIIKHGDPTDGSGSFGDRGIEYAPAIYYETEFEKAEAERVIRAIDALGVFENPLPLKVIPRVPFWTAEEYHQDYAKKNPVRYNLYRNASGRNSFIKKYWGDSASTFVVPPLQTTSTASKENSWASYVKPLKGTLKTILTPMQYTVTQDDGTEPSFQNVYDKNYEEGIYVDIVSGEPLFLSKDKYDSGTGWPSFVKPISDEVVVLHEDNTLFTKRTEVRSHYADSHLGHVFNDGPKERGGKRYCMNSAALRFIPRTNIEMEGYAYILPLMNV